MCKSTKTKDHIFQEHSFLEGIREIHGTILLSVIITVYMISDESTTISISIFPKSDLTAGMCKLQKVIVLWSWISLIS